MEVAVVDADDIDTEIHRAIHFVLGDGFGQDVKAEFVRQCLEGSVGVIVHDRHHEQDGVGAVIPRGINLDGIDNEVFTQHRHMGG